MEITTESLNDLGQRLNDSNLFKHRKGDSVRKNVTIYNKNTLQKLELLSEMYNTNVSSIITNILEHFVESTNKTTKVKDRPIFINKEEQRKEWKKWLQSLSIKEFSDHIHGMSYVNELMDMFINHYSSERKKHSDVIERYDIQC